MAFLIASTLRAARSLCFWCSSAHSVEPYASSTFTITRLLLNSIGHYTLSNKEDSSEQRHLQSDCQAPAASSPCHTQPCSAAACWPHSSPSRTLSARQRRDDGYHKQSDEPTAKRRASTPSTSCCRALERRRRGRPPEGRGGAGGGRRDGDDQRQIISRDRGGQEGL